VVLWLRSGRALAAQTTEEHGSGLEGVEEGSFFFLRRMSLSKENDLEEAGASDMRARHRPSDNEHPLSFT
jgi:hypothetical protein